MEVNSDTFNLFSTLLRPNFSKTSGDYECLAPLENEDGPKGQKAVSDKWRWWCTKEKTRCFIIKNKFICNVFSVISVSWKANFWKSKFFKILFSCFNFSVQLIKKLFITFCSLLMFEHLVLRAGEAHHPLWQLFLVRMQIPGRNDLCKILIVSVQFERGKKDVKNGFWKKAA